MEKLTFQKIAEERGQTHSLRKKLYEDLEIKLLISCFNKITIKGL